MSASLVGSEMCIRDSIPTRGACIANLLRGGRRGGRSSGVALLRHARGLTCLLYTSDAADDM
eukprot:7386694-Alexandrium_andersonii.AAC.1